MPATGTPNRARKIATRLASHLQGFLSGRIDEPSLARKLQTLATDIGSGAVTRQPAPSHQAEVSQVFDHWKRRMSKDDKTKLTDGRKRVICARLKEGFSVETLLAAIDGCSASEFHMGQNDDKTVHNDLTLILRNGEKVEQFAEKREQQDPNHNVDPKVERMNREAADALGRGDVDAYNRITEQLNTNQPS